MAQSEYGFTGEPFDATSGLLYLRARHYRPANGTFASRDPFEGMMSRPMSRNGYGWVEGRVADGRDPSGLRFGREQIGGRYQYSFNCGWLDRNHIQKSDSVASDIEGDLRWIKNIDFFQQTIWGISVEQIMQNIFGVIISSPRDFMAFVPSSSIAGVTSNVENLAVSIFMSANENLERDQGSYSGVPILGPAGAGSSFSEEDLPSNIIEFYIGYGRNEGRFATSQIGENDVRTKCGVVSTDTSLLIFDLFYKDGIRVNWRSWYPRLLALELSGSLCSEYQIAPASNPLMSLEFGEFPYAFRRLLDLRIPRIVGQTWWWQSEHPTNNIYALAQQPSRERVYELINWS